MNLLTQADIAKYAGFKENQKSAIVRWLKENNIKFHYGKGGTVCTTQAALDYSLIGRKNDEPETVEFL